MSKLKKVSIVMCTYNGEKYLRQQIDTLLNQTYPIHEIVIQDDHSTDGTVQIIKEYTERYPIIKFYYNEKDKGVNNNFFSAFEKATGDYIAISDQDDLWAPNKIEKQIETIGDNFICVCRSTPFNEDGTNANVDKRIPNSNPVHFLYYAMPGHCMLFKKELLKYIPYPYVNYRTYYDWMILFAASCLSGVKIINEFLVKHRRHVRAATFQPYDSNREYSYSNGLMILWWSIKNFNNMQAPIQWKFKPRLDFLNTIPFESEIKKDLVKILQSEGKGIRGIFPLMKFHIKYRNYLFFTYSKGFVNYCRAALFCVMHLYNYRYLLEDNLNK